MEANSDAGARQRDGTIEITELPPPMDGQGAIDVRITKRLLYRWLPPEQIREELPEWFVLALECWVGAEGTRRFWFPDVSQLGSRYRSKGLQYLSARPVLVTSIGGYYLLRDRGQLDDDHLLSPHVSRLFLQYVEHRREYLGPTAKLAQRLGICAGGRTELSRRNILPDDLGLDAHGDGEVWNLGRLTEEGLQAAQSAGVENPRPDQVLRYGLLEAAAINPLYLNGDNAAPIVRLSLFALPESTDKVTDEQLAFVAGQVEESLRDHIEDSDEDFAKWIEDPKSNLLHRISKRTDCQMDRQHVKKVLGELGWRSLQSLGSCVDAQMQAFHDALPDALTGREAHLFGLMFLAHDAFGGLPAMLLHERFDFLREPILNVLGSPSDSDAVAILHRVLYYYSVLIGNRRKADRLYKRRAPARTTDGGISCEVEWNENRDTEAEDEEEDDYF